MKKIKRVLAFIIVLSLSAIFSLCAGCSSKKRYYADELDGDSWLAYDLIVNVAAEFPDSYVQINAGTVQDLSLSITSYLGYFSLTYIENHEFQSGNYTISYNIGSDGYDIIDIDEALTHDDNTDYVISVLKGYIENVIPKASLIRQQ